MAKKKQRQKNKAAQREPSQPVATGDNLSPSSGPAMIRSSGITSPRKALPATSPAAADATPPKTGPLNYYSLDHDAVTIQNQHTPRVHLRLHPSINPVDNNGGSGAEQESPAREAGLRRATKSEMSQSVSEQPSLGTASAPVSSARKSGPGSAKKSGPPESIPTQPSSTSPPPANSTSKKPMSGRGSQRRSAKKSGQTKSEPTHPSSGSVASMKSPSARNSKNEPQGRRANKADSHQPIPPQPSAASGVSPEPPLQGSTKEHVDARSVVR